jgi:hypothetical protein
MGKNVIRGRGKGGKEEKKERGNKKRKWEVKR